MFDRKKTEHLADLSKLLLSEAEMSRMTDELNNMLALADNVLGIQGDLPEEFTVNAANLRDDEVLPSLKREDVLAAGETKNNCFATKRVV